MLDFGKSVKTSRSFGVGVPPLQSDQERREEVRKFLILRRTTPEDSRESPVLIDPEL